MVADADRKGNGKVVWGFDDGRGGHVRYTSTLTDTTWTEVGESSREKQQGFPIFETKPAKVKGS